VSKEGEREKEEKEGKKRPLFLGCFPFVPDLGTRRFFASFREGVGSGDVAASLFFFFGLVFGFRMLDVVAVKAQLPGHTLMGTNAFVKVSIGRFPRREGSGAAKRSGKFMKVHGVVSRLAGSTATMPHSTAPQWCSWAVAESQEESEGATAAGAKEGQPAGDVVRVPIDASLDTNGWMVLELDPRLAHDTEYLLRVDVLCKDLIQTHRLGVSTSRSTYRGKRTRSYRCNAQEVDAVGVIDA
jgi:hypothetical protein